MQKKRNREAFRWLQRFRKATVTASGPFFCELCDWLMRPFDRSTVSPNPQSALAKLPQFAGNPTWDPVAASALLRSIFHNQPNIRCAPPPLGRSSCDAFATRNDSQQAWTIFPRTCLTICPKPPNGCYINTSWRSGTRGQSRFLGRTPRSPSRTKREIQGMRQTTAPSPYLPVCIKHFANLCSCV